MNNEETKRDEMPRHNYSDSMEDSQVEKSYLFLNNEETTTESKSLHTKGVWSRRDLEIIGPYSSNKSICEMTGNFMDKSESLANAKRIVTCVNSHDELVKALQDMQEKYRELSWKHYVEPVSDPIYVQAIEALKKAGI